jgi:hypothetical protein
MRAGVASILAGLVAAGAAHTQSLNVTATYEAKLLLKVADLRTDQVVGPAGYKAGARLTTIGALGVIKPSVLLDQADGRMAGPAPMPVRFIQTEKNGTKHRNVAYAGGSGARSLADPLTQLLRAALQPGGGSPCVGAVPVYDGRQRYDLTLAAAGGGTLSGPAGGFGLTRPLNCRVSFHPISGFSAGPSRPNPFLRGDPVMTFAYAPKADVWVMTDVSVPTMVGTGHIALTSLHLDGARPPPGPAPKAPAKSRRGHA